MRQWKQNSTFSNDGKWFNITNSLNQSIIAINQQNVLCNKQEMLDELQSCNHKKADSKLLFHVYHPSQKRFRKLSIITVDTDVIGIGLYHFFTLFHWAVGRIWYWSTSKIYSNKWNSLREKLCWAIPFWFVLTGCDTVFQGEENKLHGRLGKVVK